MTSTMELVAPPNCSFCKQKAAELKQLQEQITNLRDQARIHGERYRAMEAEVERLRGATFWECAHCGVVTIASDEELKAHVEICKDHPLFKARAEIKRLREEILDQISHTGVWKKKLKKCTDDRAEFVAEIERLRMEVTEHERCVGCYEEELETLRALDESLSRERDALRSRLDAAVELWTYWRRNCSGASSIPRMEGLREYAAKLRGEG